MCHFHVRAIARGRKALFHLRMSKIVFAAKKLAKKRVKEIAHEHTIICKQLFAGHVVGSRPMKRKKHLHRMIILVILNMRGVSYLNNTPHFLWVYPRSNNPRGMFSL